MPGQKAPEEYRRKDIVRAAYDVAARRGVEALTVRAVAARAAVSHGTVLFHFSRRDALVVSLLDSVLDATTVLRVPEEVERLTRPEERLRMLLRAEMERLSSDPRQFRLFLEYWALGVRNAIIRRRVSAALERYRAAFRAIGEAVVHDGSTRGRRGTNTLRDVTTGTPDGVAALAVSVIHGCALQAVIDPKAFSVQQHFDTAARMLGGFGHG
jgi:TetR/AcrR family transcriptional regulator, transcriptional repressor of bet genes